MTDAFDHIINCYIELHTERRIDHIIREEIHNRNDMEEFLQLVVEMLHECSEFDRDDTPYEDLPPAAIIANLKRTQQNHALFAAGDLRQRSAALGEKSPRRTVTRQKDDDGAERLSADALASQELFLAFLGDKSAAKPAPEDVSPSDDADAPANGEHDDIPFF